MDTTTILISTFVTLIGLQICIPEAPNGKFEKETIEKFWTRSPLLRIIYGLSNILGVLFVLGFVIYLAFSEHWWYIGVYIGGLLLAKLIAFILRLILYPFYKKISSIYAEVVLQRIVGIVLILVGMALSVIM
jgi:hypothetical protein